MDKYAMLFFPVTNPNMIIYMPGNLSQELKAYS